MSSDPLIQSTIWSRSSPRYPRDASCINIEQLWDDENIDKTVQPPALSSYGIALRNECTGTSSMQALSAHVTHAGTFNIKDHKANIPGVDVDHQSRRPKLRLEAHLERKRSASATSPHSYLSLQEEIFDREASFQDTPTISTLTHNSAKRFPTVSTVSVDQVSRVGDGNRILSAISGAETSLHSTALHSVHHDSASPPAARNPLTFKRSRLSRHLGRSLAPPKRANELGEFTGLDPPPQLHSSSPSGADTEDCLASDCPLNQIPGSMMPAPLRVSPDSRISHRSPNSIHQTPASTHISYPILVKVSSIRDVDTALKSIDSPTDQNTVIDLSKDTHLQHFDHYEALDPRQAAKTRIRAPPSVIISESPPHSRVAVKPQSITLSKTVNMASPKFLRTNASPDAALQSNNSASKGESWRSDIGGQENLTRNAKTFSKANGTRIPLQPVVRPMPNHQQKDGFRKPKLPKSITHTNKNPSNLQVSHLPSTLQYGKSLPCRTQDPYESDSKKDIMTINGKQYEKLELLGRGGSAKVYKARLINSNRSVAVKKVDFDQFEENCVAGFKGEIDLLLKLSHSERAVTLIDHALHGSLIYLVMECGDIDLAHVFQSKLGSGSVLDVNFVRYHAIEMFKCVKEVHAAGIVHSDLKPANFLFVRGILKLIDFGIANAVPEYTCNVYRDTQIGTPNYMAPEALIEINPIQPGSMPLNHTMPKTVSNQQSNTWKVGKPSDVWSCGCIIYQMVYGKPPYGSFVGNQRVQAIMSPNVRIEYSKQGLGGLDVPQSVIELMQSCLMRDPSLRATVDECLQSNFLSPNIVSKELVRDLVHLAVSFGYNNHAKNGPPLTNAVYNAMVETVIAQIRDLNYA